MRITDDIHWLQSAPNSNVYLIQGESTLLVDTGFPHRARALLEEIAALGVDPKSIDDILLTHHDLDHVGNAAALQQATGATLWIGRDDAPYLMGQRPRPGVKRVFTLLTGVKKPTSCRYYEEKSDFGGVTALPAPGHTPGHRVLQYGRAVFSGDLFRASEKGFTLMPPAMNSDQRQVRQSLRRLAALDFDVLCPSHGTPLKRSSALDAFLASEGRD